MKIDAPDYDAEVLDDGRVFVWDNDDDAIAISAKAKPVLLAALLEDAGAVKCVGTYCPDCGLSSIDDYGKCNRCDTMSVGGKVWLLPVKDGGTG